MRRPRVRVPALPRPAGLLKRTLRPKPAGRTEPARRLLPRTRARRLLPRTTRARRRTVQALMLGTVLALTPATWMHAVADSRLRTTADVPAQDVAVVFGAGLWNGRPTPYLAHRLDTAAELYRSGKVKVVLVTGDNSRIEYDEPDAMRAYLAERGVPDGRIVSDYAGFDTWDSCVRAKKIFGVDRAVLVTQDFHIERAVALCGAAGVESYGVGVAEPHDATFYYGGARELFAAGKAALDAALRPDPHFLGEREKGVTEALASAR
ncbi:YdcF family protein [Streptomyces sp. ISL-36]|uniref:SanA/YdcF family protein n=1 Tax=Streptomyces sp. ISL-36 TaxID=2819182 RepID=UPI001BE59846|nr:ElyC/SanA/YdcF family protein [Streptomyces sp. ISL-36]MBT2444829.1 YdcF family protein [Streptomyces sp. ISL-36]